MRRIAMLLIGLVLLPPLLSPLPMAHAKPLYDTIKEDSEKQLQSAGADDEVAKFVEAIAKEKKWGVTQEEIAQIMKGDSGVCAKHPEINGYGCFTILAEIKNLVTMESSVRLAGRRLQSIATSYELPVSEIPGRSSTISGDLNGVVNLWKAGTGSVTASGSGNTIPTVAIEDKDMISPLLQNLAGVLGGLSKEERIGAVWKYQYGERLVRGQRAPTFPAPTVLATDGCDKTERRMHCKRWENVENALDAIWTELRKKYGTNPELPVFYLTVPKELEGELPDDIILWARMDKDPKHPAGDVGLQWKYPFEPVLPSLTDEKGDPILGGNYPPAPLPKGEEKAAQTTEGGRTLTTKEQAAQKREEVKKEEEKKEEGSGLCSMSFALRGYLCHPVTQSSAQGCPKPEDADKDAVTLVGCTFEGKEKTTEVGPDVCQDILWQATDKEKKPTTNVCTPEALTKYRNTIGNNLCFIGQCVEQSLETHRVTGGRTPAGVQDRAFPNDDLLAGSPLGNFLTAPTAGHPILPAYKPLVPVREFEAALCALVGLPAGTSSALCTIAANRRADAPLGDSLSTILSIADIGAAQSLTSAEAASLAESVGTRMGTDLYARNLRVMSKTLAEVLGVASKLLKEMQSIDFPTEMCPMGLPPSPAPTE